MGMSFWVLVWNQIGRPKYHISVWSKGPGSRGRTGGVPPAVCPDGQTLGNEAPRVVQRLPEAQPP